MKNLVLVLVIVLFTCGLSRAQTSFIVKTWKKDVLSGVEVFHHKEAAGKTDEQGKFEMNGIEKGDTVIFLLKNYMPFYYVAETKKPKKEQEILMHFWVYSLEENKQGKIPADSSGTAVFPGGREEMRKWIALNMKYPQSAIDNGIRGKCYLQFVIEEDGSVSNVKVVRGVPDCPECDQEAIRLMNAMPKWVPQKVNGAAVRSFYHIPLTFIAY